jgi:hypothetical protein
VTHNTDKVGFPAIPLTSGMVITLEARDPTTDAEVAGVTSSRWMIYGEDESAGDLTDVIPLYAGSDEAT